MSPSMERFGEYLRLAIRRERWRHTLRFVAVLSLALLVITAVGAWAGLFRGFTPLLTNSVRVVLAAMALLCLVFLLWRPLRGLQRDKGAALVETADAAFDGRVYTYLDTRAQRPDQPFLSLLAQDALSVARRVPLQRIVPTASLVWPVLVLLLVLGTVFATRLLAPVSWQNAALHLWWGWQDTTLVEPRSVAVLPGDIELLAGEDLPLAIELQGFRPDSVTLHARSGTGEWQTTPISQSPDQRFNFTLYRVNEALEYYVTAAYTQSPTYQVSVIQPARLERIDAIFEYPEWTRLTPATRVDVGNISGVKNTLVSLVFQLDRPLQDGALRMADRLLVLEALETPENPDDNVQGGVDTQSDSYRYRASFVIDNDTQYQLIDRMLDREVPISSEYAVSVRGDEAPSVKLIKPGRDVTASPIEEVSIGIEAEDDFSVESVELLYSVNAGEWQSIMLPAQRLTEHVFYLESMGSSEPSLDELAGLTPETSDEAVPAPPEELTGLVMQPGDLISYYVRVRDHDSVSETDMMLIDVRPFERRFSEGQGGASGGAGGGGANEGSEISRRQKEIFLATWNLQRTTDALGGETAGQEDNARLLSELQVTLAEQARTLADRSEARDLVEQGEKIRQFVDYLRAAAIQMEPSASALQTLDFERAIQPQQKALQLLQRAEALFADIRMTQQQGQGGGGQQAGQDMAEMFELEMDLERNQYEQPDRGGKSAASEQLDDVFDQLAELARRQQALAEAERQRNELTREEQWQQQQLARELEQMQRDLEQLQRDAANAEGSEAQELAEAARSLSEQLQRAQEALEESAQQGQQQQAGNQSESSSQTGSESSEQAGAEPGSEQGDQQQGGQQAAGDNGSDAGSSAEAEGTQSAAGSPDGEAASGAQNASQALQEALEGLGEKRSRELASSLGEAYASADELLEEQRSVEEILRQAVDRAMRSRENGVFDPGLTREDMKSLSERKKNLQQDLETAKNDIEALEQRYGDQAPQTGRALEQALQRLDEGRVIEMLGIAGDAIDNGSLVTVLPGESLVTNSLREWRDRLGEARDAAGNENLQSRQDQDMQVADALEQLQQLR